MNNRWNICALIKEATSPHKTVTSTHDEQRLSIGYRLYGSKTRPIKWNAVFFQAAVLSMLLYGCTTWMLTKRMEKELNGNHTRMLRAILNKSWRQHPTKHQLYGHLPSITKTIKVRRTWHAGNCWRNRDELISDILLWTPSYGGAKPGRLARTYIQQPCADTGCCVEDPLEATDDRGEWQERSEISVLMVYDDDDDDIYLYVCVCVFVCVCAACVRHFLLLLVQREKKVIISK